MLANLTFTCISDDTDFKTMKLVPISALKSLDFAVAARRYVGVEIFNTKHISSYLGKEGFNVYHLDGKNPSFGPTGELCTTPLGVYLVFSRMNAKETSPYREYSQPMLLEMLDRCEPFLTRPHYLKKDVKLELEISQSTLEYREALAREVFNLPKFGQELTAREYAACIILEKKGPMKNKLLGLAVNAELNGTPRPCAETPKQVEVVSDLSWLD